MKNSKFLMPMLAFVMAVGMAFANTANDQASAWINLNGVATQLSSDPCQPQGNFNCKVIFEEDEQEEIFEVYTDQSLQTLKRSPINNPYVVPGMPQ
ncbi:DUF6520 family protein [Psychroflexus montanilacus]|uniref:DUF6520 family protein n=1 Tax=Psychroflexus montanilacus TaxID=2873598 RepID=UPI001CCAEBBC|nr:DUF6520 family protein [Psychroflexus montanilacus]MBZ9650869.1 DUF6520 family protein [Psychroflexus montanilacus]